MEQVTGTAENKDTTEKYKKKSAVALRQIGELLYGVHWKRLLAEDLNLDPRRIPQWISEDFPVPPGIWNDLKAVIEKKQMNSEKAKRILYDNLD